MTELSPENSASINTEQQSRALRAVLLTVLLTSCMLIIDGIRNVVSIEATVAAVTIGVVAGIAVSATLERLQIRVRNDVRTTIAAFVSTGIATVLCWIIIPIELLQTVPQFGLAFLWGFSIITVTRDMIWPKAIDSVNP